MVCLGPQWSANICKVCWGRVELQSRGHSALKITCFFFFFYKGRLSSSVVGLHRSGVLNYFFLRATKDRRQFKDSCLRAKWSPLSYVFLCILGLTKGQTSMVCGPDLAHGPPFEKAWHRCQTTISLLPCCAYLSCDVTDYKGCMSPSVVIVGQGFSIIFSCGLQRTEDSSKIAVWEPNDHHCPMYFYVY